MAGLIEQVHAAFCRDGTRLVPDESILLVPTEEVAKYRKLSRGRENSLAPNVVRNRTDADVEAGRRKWDELIESMCRDGFRRDEPIELIITRDPKLRVHQGHHRIGAALEVGIPEIPVRFRYRDG